MNDALGFAIFVSFALPILGSIIGNIGGIYRDPPEEAMRRLPYFGRIMGLYVLGVTTSFLITSASAPPPTATFNELITNIYVMSCVSAVISGVLMFFAARLTVQRCVDLGHSKWVAVTYLLVIPIFYFFLAPSRLATTQPQQA